MQQETKLLQATRLVLSLPRAVTTLQGQQAAEELPAALKAEAAVDN
jgi:hypothetical protein